MVRNIFTVMGETDGVNTTGVITLQSDLFTNKPNYLKFDKGLRIKIWARRVAGNPVTIRLEFSPDVTITTPTWTPVGDVITLSSPGVIELEKRRPIKIDCRRGTEGIRFTWIQDTPGKSYFTAEIEVTDEVEG